MRYNASKNCSSSREKKLVEAAINQAGTASTARTCAGLLGAVRRQGYAAGMQVAPDSNARASLLEFFPQALIACIVTPATPHNNLWGLQSAHNRINDSWLSPVKFLYFAAIVPTVANCRAKGGDRGLRSLDHIVSNGSVCDALPTIRSGGSGGLALNWRDAFPSRETEPLRSNQG